MQIFTYRMLQMSVGMLRRVRRGLVKHLEQTEDRRWWRGWGRVFVCGIQGVWFAIYRRRLRLCRRIRLVSYMYKVWTIFYF